MLGASLALPPLRRFLMLPAPSPASLALIASTAPAAGGLARLLSVEGRESAVDQHARRPLLVRG